MKTVTAFAIAASLLAGAAQAEDLNFTRDGQSYHAKVERSADETIIRGYNVTRGDRFVLRIANGNVRGRYRATPVNFPETATADRLVALR